MALLSAMRTNASAARPYKGEQSQWLHYQYPPLRQLGYLSSKARGFASPPHDGFAFHPVGWIIASFASVRKRESAPNPRSWKETRSMPLML